MHNMDKLHDIRISELVNKITEHVQDKKMSMEEVDVAYEAVRKLYYTDGLIKG